MAHRLAPGPPPQVRKLYAGPRPQPEAPEPAKDAEPRQPTSWETMYGLAGTPFEGDGPFIPFGSHRRTLEQVIEHLTHGQGLLLLLGESGVGKTTLLNAATQAAIDTGFPPARIIRLQGDGRVGDDTVPPDKVTTGRWIVLVDNVDPSALDTLESDLAASGEKAAIVAAIAIQDAPQGEKGSKAMPWVRLPALTQSELLAYVERRLWVAGGATRRLITPDALTLILQQAQGLPGLVNRLMETTLTTGFIRGDAMISRKTVLAALGPPPRARAPRSRAPRSGTVERETPSWVVPAASAVLFILGLSVFVYRAFDTPTPPTPAAPIEAPVQQSASRAPQPAPDDNQSANNQPASLQADSAATAMRRGQEAMALGDIQGARALFEQAAQTGDPAAALAAGKTYDPDFLPRHPVPSTLPDRAKAMAWYKRAAAQGDGDAASLLARAKRLPRQ